MAAGGVTSTGLTETRAAVRRLPRAAVLAFRAVAWRISRRVMLDAQSRLRQQTHGTGATAAVIRVLENETLKQFIVESKAPIGRPANLPLWIEFGTVKQPARPYMGPAGDAVRDDYRQEMADAAERTGREVLG